MIFARTFRSAWPIVVVTLVSSPTYAASNGPLSNATGRCSPPASESLNVHLHPQEANYWCWAASGQMIMEYMGKGVSQCEQVNDRFQKTVCCRKPVPQAQCDHGGWPQFEKHGLTFKKTHNAALSWEELKAQLAAKDPNNPCSFTPFAFTWQYRRGGGHMMVAIGYKTVDSVNFIQIQDPLKVNIGDTRFITYDAYVSGTNDQGNSYSHWDDYYDIK